MLRRIQVIWTEQLTKAAQQKLIELPEESLTKYSARLLGAVFLLLLPLLAFVMGV
jgi:hypothetical protein